MSKFHQSIYYPRNVEKYKGSKYPIARSSWERSFMEYFDNNPQVLEWASEPFPIPYVKPTDGKVHRYFPDFAVIYQNTNGEIRKELIEVKPYAQSRPSRSKNPQRRLAESVTYAVNTAKWVAAQAWCQKNGFAFRILTEKGDMTAVNFKQ